MISAKHDFCYNTINWKGYLITNFHIDINFFTKTNCFMTDLYHAALVMSNVKIVNVHQGSGIV